MTIAKSIRHKINQSCIERRCKREGCQIKMDGVSQGYTLIDMDCYVPSDKRRCDFLFVGSISHTKNEWVIPLELKRGQVKVNNVVDQLQAGAEIAERLVPPTADIKFRPIVASGHINREQSQKLLTQKITFRGEKFAIFRIRCGSAIAKAV